MNTQTTPAFALAGLNTPSISDESGTVYPAKCCAVGFVSCDVEIAEFRIEAFAMDPLVPADHCAQEIARWLIDRPCAPSYLIGLAIEDTMLAGFAQLLQGPDLLSAFDLLHRMGEWSRLGRAQLAPPDGEGVEVASVFRALTFERSKLDVLEVGEGRGPQTMARARDMVATQAVMRWIEWADGPGECGHLRDSAFAALSEWRAAKAAN